MKFSGYLLDKHFGPTEAESPIDVYHQWKCDGDPPMDELRCWVLLVVPNVTTVWLEVVLGLPDFFEHLRSRFEDHVTIEFRYKGSPSPNTSPDVFPSKESEGDTMETLQAVSESFSTLEIRPTNTGASSTPSQPDVAELINDKDPFTLEDVEDPIYLRFKKKSLALGEEIVCVSLESFQMFVQAEAGAGKNLINLELNRVMCKDGRERNFVISERVWILSVLESSQTMRNNFRNYLQCSIERETQLEGLKEDQNLWKRVQFWVADLVDFSSAEERLTMPTSTEEGICPFMSPCYFTPAEAKLLGSLLMPNTTDLLTTMTIMLEEKAKDGAVAVCASHDIAPVLMVGFETKTNFHKQEGFKREKKAWIEKQDKMMKTKLQRT